MSQIVAETSSVENRIRSFFHNQNPGLLLRQGNVENERGVSLDACSVVKTERYYGAMKRSRTADNLALPEEFFANFESLPFDDDAAKIYGEVRSALARHDMPMGPNDLMPAAIALANGTIVVTHNARDFSRVNGLELVDWELA